MKRWRIAFPLLLVLVAGLIAAPGLRAGNRLGAQEPRPEGTGSRIRDVIYGYKQGVATTMDVFKPAKPNGTGVLWLVSGGWASSHDAINPGVAVPFNKKGQTV